MPTYEYICRACGHEFEEFHSIKADPIAICPKCRKKKVERKIGIGGAVIFKGGGFYKTDSGKSGSITGGSSSDSSSSSSSDSSSSSASTSSAD
jgi:putative FmdB family regulatory protein